MAGFIVLAGFLLLPGLTFHPTAAAAALSDHCAEVAGGLYDRGEAETYMDEDPAFNPGEVITVHVYGRGVGSFQLEAPSGTVVAGPTSIPGTLSFTWTGKAKTFVINIFGEGLFNIEATCGAGAAAGESTPPPPKWFDPGDIRVDGWAQDRLAVYCRDAQTIQVIGIGANGKGAGVVLFNVSDVIAAGARGLTARLVSYTDPSVDLGLITIQMTVNDGVTTFYVAWNGGILNATGQGDFKKMFVTPIRFCPFTFR